jgi:cobalt-precorrin 5A hydrolase
LTETNTAIWIVRSEALRLGKELAAHFNAKLFCPWQASSGNQKDDFRHSFPDFERWILVMATGIAVRYLDGLPKDKKSDPAVVVLDEGCHHAIALLSGHEGGANELAFAVANLTGARPVVTTATESLKPLIVGVGCRKGISSLQIEAAVLNALGDRSISEIRELATIDLKSQEPGILDFCEKHSIPLRWFSQTTIAARPWVSKASEWVREQIGVDGVCEPCALLASTRGKLIVPKLPLNGVAVAIVEDIRREGQ